MDWHGNFEMDVGHLAYGWQKGGGQAETVYDWRGRFVLGPVLTHPFADNLFVRVTGQPVAWIREDYQLYQVNVDDVYAQIGRIGTWDLMAGRFLTWRVFRKGLGFDLYTLEENGTRVDQDVSAEAGWFPRTYEVNTIFMRDSFGTNPVPQGRAAFHYYPTAWSGIEAVGTYGRLRTGGDVLGGRLAAGLKIPFISLLGGTEYVIWNSAFATPNEDPKPDSAAGSLHATYGFGGSIGLNPWRWLEIVGDYAYRKAEYSDGSRVYLSDRMTSWGGYLQVDPLLAYAGRSILIAGVSFFHTEFLDSNDLFQQHEQMAGYLVHPLGFNNAVVKLVFARAAGRQDSGGQITESMMYSVRFRFAFYY